MKKEKQVKSYKRRTKSGKVVTVKAHTAKYEAADKAKELAKKKGAGEELEERKKKKPVQLEIPFDEEGEKEVLNEIKDTEKKTSKKVRPVGSGTNGPEPKKKKEPASKKEESKSSEPAFTAAEFKEWYRGTGSAADKKVAKALRAQLGRAGYRKLEDEAIDSYSSRGHLSMFKRVSGGSDAPIPTKGAKKSKADERTAKGYGDMHLATLKKNYSDVSKQEKAETSKAKKKALQKDLIAMHSELSKRGYSVNYDRDGNINNIHKKNVSMAGETVFFGTTPDWLRKVLGKNSDKIGIRMAKESKKESKNRGIQDVKKEIKDVEKDIKSLENLKKRQKKTGIGGNELAYNKLRLKQLQKELASLQKGSSTEKPKAPRKVPNRRK